MSPELKAFLLKFLETPSCTSDIAGVCQVQALAASHLGAMGFDIRYEYAEGKDSANSAPFLIAERPSKSNAKQKFISMVSHADTVDGFVHAVSFSENGKTAVGQGVLDDKASQVVALWGLKLFLEQNPKSDLAIRFISSPNEEMGSVGFHKLYAKLSQDSALVLGFEPATERGEIITSRRGNRWYRVTFKGQESHAGRAPEKGVNAAYDAARVVAKLEHLNDYAKGISVVVGSFRSARDAYNVVCGSVELKLDFRFGDFKSRDLVDKKIRTILASKARGKSSAKAVSKVSIEVVDDCPPMSSTAESQRLAKVYAQGLKQIKGATPAKAIASGGSADVCYMSRPELAVLDGLGAIGGGMHSTEEWVDLESVEARAQALAFFLASGA